MVEQEAGMSFNASLNVAWCMAQAMVVGGPPGQGKGFGCERQDGVEHIRQLDDVGEAAEEPWSEHEQVHVGRVRAHVATHWAMWMSTVCRKMQSLAATR